MKSPITHHTPQMLEPVKQPREWDKVYVKGMSTPPTCWPEFFALSQGCSREVAEMNAQQQVKKQSAGF